METTEWEKLIGAFDLLMPTPVQEAAPPTDESIERINLQFGISLPDSLLRFARECRRYGAWFASLGPDFDSPWHIINVNERARNSEDGAGSLPEGFIVFNVGFDEDYDGFDVRRRDRVSGEYAVRHWSPGILDGAVYRSFHHYLQIQILDWMSGMKQPRRQAVQDLLSGHLTAVPLE